MKYKNVDYIVNQSFDVNSLDYEKAKMYICGIEEVALTTGQSYIIFDYYKHNYFYISSGNSYFNKADQNIADSYIAFNNKFLFDDSVMDYQQFEPRIVGQS